MDGGFVETSKEPDLSEIVSGVNSSGDVKSVTVSVVTVSVVLSVNFVSFGFHSN